MSVCIRAFVYVYVYVLTMTVLNRRQGIVRVKLLRLGFACRPKYGIFQSEKCQK